MHKRKKNLDQLKKYLPATLDNILTLDRSARLSALGDTALGHTVYGGDF